MKKIIYHNQPTLGQEEIAAVSRVIKSNWIAQGEEVKKFENEFSAYLGGRPGQAVAVSSGTAALYLALLGLGIGAGDEVIAPTYVCSAVLNAIFMANAKPVLADVNQADFNISFKDTKRKINLRTKAVIVPHIFGMPAEIDKFIKLGIPVIEDCAQAIGAKFNGQPVGTFGRASIFSFYASKPITTGYGGMLFSRDKNFINQVRDYREFDCRQTYKRRFNFQLADFQAALGRVQLKKLPQFLKKRKKIASEYYEFLLTDKTWPFQADVKKQPNYYRFLVRTNNSRSMQAILSQKGITTIVPIERYELLHRYLKQSPKKFPISELAAKTTLSLPIYPSLTKAQIKYIIENVNKILLT